MNYSGYLKDSEGNIYYPRPNIKITNGIEFETGRVIDGKKEYGKRINCGYLTNGGTTTVDTGLGNQSIIYTDIRGIAEAGWQYPYVMSPQGTNSGIAEVSVSGSSLKIKSNADLSSYIGYVELHYIKN